MAVSDQRLTVLEVINEVRQRVKLNVVATVDADKDSLLKLKYLNDVVSEISDFGDWQEALNQITVTAQSSVADYSLSTQAETQVSVMAVQNIHEIVFDTDVSPMQLLDLDDLRRMRRAGSEGSPKHWAVKGTDSVGNPKFSVNPLPVSAEAGKLFTIQIFAKPVFYVTADGAIRPPFPGKLLVQGLYAKTILDESDGEPTARYSNVKNVFDEMLYETYNRYNGDSGGDIWFRPSRGGR